MLNYFDVIKAQSGIPVDDIWAQLWGNTMSTEYIISTYSGTLPATLTGTEAGHLENYKIYGNAIQDGTPTPENPIEPSGCGVRTENLFPLSWPIESPSGYIYNNELDIDTSILTIKTSFYCSVALVDKTGTTVFNQNILSNSSVTVDIPNGLKAIRVYSSQAVSNGKFMLNTGSTPLPYEPYGYKLSLTVNGMEYPIYLGEVPTARKIKKLVLTGEETLTVSNTNNRRVPIGIHLKSMSVNDLLMEICTHFITNASSEATVKSENDYTTRLSPSSSVVWFFLPKTFFVGEITVANCRNQFSAWLATQYAAGTPVTVWYVLAEPETGIVNEPLMKIGDYADTIDSTQSTVQIPTLAGTTTIDYNGEPKPDKVELTYKKRKG